MKMRLVAVGDSVMWGQGLGHEQRFAHRVAKALEGQGYDISWDRLFLDLPIREPDGMLSVSGPDFKAHSGAIIGELDANEDPVPGNVRARFGEISSPGPTVLEQLHGIEDGDDVDLVLMTGGGNDIEFSDSYDSRNDYAELRQRVATLVPRRVPTMLEQARRRCPNATLVLAGYYIPVSVDSGFVERQRDGASGAVTILTGGLNLLVIEGLHLEHGADMETWARSNQRGYVEMLYWMTRAIFRFNRDTAGAPALFVSTGWRSANAADARNALVYPTDAPLIDGVPLYPPSQCPPDASRSMHDLRLAEVARLGIEEDIFHPSTFHPNPEGARRYAERILQRLPLAADELSLRDLWESNTAAEDEFGLRETFERYGLDPGPSVRAMAQCTIIDSIRVRCPDGARWQGGAPGSWNVLVYAFSDSLPLGYLGKGSTSVDEAGRGIFAETRGARTLRDLSQLHLWALRMTGTDPIHGRRGFDPASLGEGSPRVLLEINGLPVVPEGTEEGWAVEARDLEVGTIERYLNRATYELGDGSPAGPVARADQPAPDNVPWTFAQPIAWTARNWPRPA